MDPVKDKVDDDGQKDDHHTKRGVHMVEWIENRVRVGWVHPDEINAYLCIFGFRLAMEFIPK
ncbi:hypothetical protein BLOT_001967 [Blomia tropicalis]|nr:hypothetical protein BLOT_001967 [Blomia tropicalis]